jgi:hypothetical protein
MRAGVGWTDALIARLKALHADDDMSFTEIANQLSEEFMVKLTKNACIGKARRLGLKERARVAPPLPRKGQKRGGSRYRPPPVVLPGWQVEPPRLPAHADRITIYQLKSGVCHFPFGERPPYAYCGHTTRRGLPWCPHHETVVYPRGNKA